MYTVFFVSNSTQALLVLSTNQRGLVSRSSRADGDVEALFLQFVVRLKKLTNQKRPFPRPTIIKVSCIVLSCYGYCPCKCEGKYLRLMTQGRKNFPTEAAIKSECLAHDRHTQIALDRYTGEVILFRLIQDGDGKFL